MKQAGQKVLQSSLSAVDSARKLRPVELWTLLISSFMASIFTGGLFGFALVRDSTYTEFIVGSSAWEDFGKTGDFLFLTAVPIVFAVFLLLFSVISQKLATKNNKVRLAFFDALKWSLSLLAISVASQLFIPRIDPVLPLLAAAGLGCALLLFGSAGLTSVSIDLWTRKTALKTWAFNVGLPFILYFSITLIARAMQEVSAMGGLPLSIPQTFALPLVILLSGLFYLLWTSRHRRIRKFSEEQESLWIRRALIVAASGFPFGFLWLAPQKYLLGENLWNAVEVSSSFVGLIVFLVFASYLAGGLAWRNSKTSPNALRVLLSLFLFGLIVYLKAPVSGLSSITDDDYHFGELVVPGFLLQIGEFEPYETIDLARGLVNLVPSVISSLFFDGTIASYAVSSSLAFFLILMILTMVMASTVGLVPAFILIMFAPVRTTFFEIDMLASVMLFSVILLLFNNQRLLALILYFFFGVLLLLFAPGQGALMILALSVSFVVSFLQHRIKKTEIVAIFSVGLLTVTLMVQPSSFVWGFVRYGLEQSRLNEQAYGVPWVYSLNSSQDNLLGFEALRAGFILVPIALLAVFLLRGLSERTSRERLLIGGLPIALLAIMYIPRAAGRIDPDSISRLGLATLWFLLILLPFALFFVSRLRITPVSAVVILIPSLALASIGSGQPLNLNNLGQRSSLAFSTQAMDPLLAEKSGQVQASWPALGRVLMSDFQIERLNRLKGVTKLIESGSADFLDLTNRSAAYAYLGLVPPVTAPAVYNLVSEGQQLRSIERLKLAPPKIILVRDYNIMHDGGPLPLRSPYLYRWLLQEITNYQVFESESTTWLIRNQLVREFENSTSGYVHVEGEQYLAALSQTLSVSDLKSIPVSWGRGANVLETRLDGSPVNLDQNVGTTNNISLDSGWYKVRGSDPWVRYSFPQGTLTADGLHVLKFRLECDSPQYALQNMKIYWATNQNAESEINSLMFRARCNSSAIVPLYANLAFALSSDEMVSLRLDFEAPTNQAPMRILSPEIRAIRANSF